LLAAFKEPNPNKEIPIVDLTRDDRQPTTALAIFTREPARSSRVVIKKPVRRPTRMVVPTMEKGLQQMEAKIKGKKQYGSLDGFLETVVGNMIVNSFLML
jgi:hypothetical protein